MAYAVAEQGIPGNAEVYLQQAFAYRQMGRWAESIRAMERAIELDPRNTEQLTNQGNSYTFQRDYSRAREYFQRALEVAPDDLMAYLGNALPPLYSDGDSDATLAAMRNPLMDFGVWQPWARLWAWTAALHEKDFDSALGFLDNWNEEIIDHARLDYVTRAQLRGETHRLAGRPEQAVAHFEAARIQLEEALEANPDDPRLHVALGQASMGLGDSEAAMRLADSALELLPALNDAPTEDIIRYGLIVRVLAPAEAAEFAIEELDAYLSGPGQWSIEGLLPDPRLDPIRDDPRFQALVERYTRQ